MTSLTTSGGIVVGRENNCGGGVPFEEMRSRIIVQETRFVSFQAYPSGN